MKAAAFFDIDGTLYREGLITEIFKKLVKYEIISAEKWYNEVRPRYIMWDKRQGDYDSYLLKMVDIYTESVKELSKSQVEYISKQVVKQKGDRVYTYTRDRIRWHRENGHKILAISGSPMELVREMANKYGFDDFKGAVYVLDESDRYTGGVIPMWDSESKCKAVKELVEKYDIDLSESFAYGDTAGDFSMFQLVEHPFCVNPTKELINKVLTDKMVKEKVKIVVERKDVVYMLKTDCIDIY